MIKFEDDKRRESIGWCVLVIRGWFKLGGVKNSMVMCDKWDLLVVNVGVSSIEEGKVEGVI